MQIYESDKSSSAAGLTDHYHQLQDALMTGVYVYTYVMRFNFYYKSSSAAGSTDQWYICILMSGVSTSTISHHQLQDALINGMYNFV